MAHFHEEIIETNDRDLFDRIAEKYAKKDIVKSSSLPRRYQLMFAIQPIVEVMNSLGNIVEIACGFGASSEYLKGMFEKYIGVDYSEKLIAKAKEFYAENERVNFLAANVKELARSGIPVKSADLILAVGALHHMTELGAVMESLKHIAKDEAYFVAIEPNRANPMIQAMRWVWGRINTAYSRDQKYFSKQELYNLLSRHKMRDISVEFQGFFTPPFAQVVLNPQFLSVPASNAAIFLDKILDRYLPSFLKFLSWNIVIRAKFPAEIIK